MNSVLQYFYNLGSVFDRVVNTVLGGDPRQTLSSRMGRDIEAGRCPFCGWVCRRLDVLQRGHCASAWASEQKPLNPDMQVAGD